jgi:hypothetical protein
MKRVFVAMKALHRVLDFFFALLPTLFLLACFLPIRFLPFTIR